VRLEVFGTPTPDDSYLTLLGRAAYTWAYTEWVLIYCVPWATGHDLSGLAGKTGGRIIGAFADVVKAQTAIPSDIHRAAEEGSDLLAQLNHRRNGILHAGPATVDDGQRLHRWGADPSSSEPWPYSTRRPSHVHPAGGTGSVAHWRTGRVAESGVVGVARGRCAAQVRARSTSYTSARAAKTTRRESSQVNRSSTC
jgi:hypothetical protein